MNLYVIGLFLTLSIPHTLETAFGMKHEHTNWRKTQKRWWNALAAVAICILTRILAIQSSTGAKTAGYQIPA